MKRGNFIFILLILQALSAISQNPERKIIIENGVCYYTTIDPEFQIATLYAVAFDKPMKMAKKYVLPAGRNVSIPIIPFSWDMVGKDVFAINFMNNALNNRRNAIKRIPINTLNEWTEKTSISDVVMKSTEIQPYIPFEPYSYITDKSSVLDHFFFDAVATTDSSFCFAVSNNGELTIWHHANKKWERGETINMQTNDFFSLFLYKKQVYLATSEGKIYAIQNNTLLIPTEKNINKLLADGVLIVNKMNNTVSFIDKAKLNEQKSLEEMMKSSSIPLFL